MRHLALALTLCMAFAAASPAAAATGAGAAASTETQTVDIVHLRVWYEGREIRFLIRNGGSAEITDHVKKSRLQLVPSLQPGPEDGRKQVSLAILELLDLDGQARPAPPGSAQPEANLVDVILLSEEGSVAPISQHRMEIALIDVSTIEAPVDSEGGSSLRPRSCCITCDGVTSCGDCVWTDCGHCCGG